MYQNFYKIIPVAKGLDDHDQDNYHKNNHNKENHD